MFNYRIQKMPLKQFWLSGPWCLEVLQIEMVTCFLETDSCSSMKLTWKAPVLIMLCMS